MISGKDTVKKILEADSININFIANCIRDMSLISDRNYLYPKEEMQYAQAEGIGITWQKPLELAKAVMFLSQFDINSYCEIGIYKGGSLAIIGSVLKRVNPNIKITALDIEIQNEIEGVVDALCVEIINNDSSEISGTEFDLVFIDGGHTYKDASNDYANVGRFSKICMFHDIVDHDCIMMHNSGGGVPALWGYLKAQRSYVEFVDQPSYALGLGILF